MGIYALVDENDAQDSSEDNEGENFEASLGRISFPIHEGMFEVFASTDALLEHVQADMNNT